MSDRITFPAPMFLPTVWGFLKSTAGQRLDFEVEDKDAFGAGLEAGGYQRLDFALGGGALVADFEFGCGEKVTFGQHEEGVLVGRLDPLPRRTNQSWSARPN